MAAGSKHGRGADQVSLRLPDGLRDRIKAYAEQHGRSMNNEIVRILEREFPEPFGIESRVAELIGLMGILRKGVTDQQVERLAEELKETIAGIMSGRVQGVDEETRREIRDVYEYWKMKEREDRHYLLHLDEEEEKQLNLYGNTEKFVIPSPDEEK